MASEKRYEFIVQGRGSFPIDMLRYDQCWPKSESEGSFRIMRSFDRGVHGRSRQTIALRSVGEPTLGRWSSFGWDVIKQRRVY